MTLTHRLRQLRLRYPTALGEFDKHLRSAYGHAAAIASACRAPQVEPIHLLYGLLKADPSDTSRPPQDIVV